MFQSVVRDRNLRCFIFLALVLNTYFFIVPLFVKTRGSVANVAPPQFVSACFDLQITKAPFSKTCHFQGLFVSLTWNADVRGIENPNISLPMNFTAGQFAVKEIKKATPDMIANALATISNGSRNPWDPPEFTYSSNTTLVFDKEAILLYNCMPNYFHFLKGCLVPLYAALKATGRLGLPDYNPQIVIVEDYPQLPTNKSKLLYARWLQFPSSNPLLYRMDYLNIPDPTRFIYFPNAWIGTYSLRYGLEESSELIVGFRKWYIMKMGHVSTIDFEQNATDGYILLVNRKSGRHITNMANVSAALERFGTNVKEVFFEDITLKEAMSLVERTSIFIGVFGAGMMNLVWGRKGMDVLEFVGTPFIDEKMFLTFAEFLSMNYHTIYSQPVFLTNYTCAGNVWDCTGGNRTTLGDSCCFLYLSQSSVFVNVTHLVDSVAEILKRKEIEKKNQ
eukprot:TRINITY_DN7233_c0_g2_i1.p1 TRINITY_DN7233_c0_g2~~TRINITY_DN7233_c0_g2_i1.p1  ORF type:complete len:448 (+),score=42.71 TRINITY_DN7233_c0_g2_i1:58-1401(+)